MINVLVTQDLSIAAALHDENNDGADADDNVDNDDDDNEFYFILYYVNYCTSSADNDDYDNDLFQLRLAPRTTMTTTIVCFNSV